MMDFSITPFEFGQRPIVTKPVPEFLELVTEEGIRKMVSDHYDLLAKSEIRHLFPPTAEALNRAKLNSSDFFIQICGGREWYNENRGKPMMVKRHAPVKITSVARTIWLQCYMVVLSKLDVPDHVLQSFWNYLNVFSTWMVNAKDE